MGNVIKQGPRVYRQIVNKKEDIFLLLHLFNGNIILPTRKIQFHRFLTTYNGLTCVIPPINYLTGSFQPSLEDLWLLGFTEAEGCFTISFLSNNIAYRTRYILSQKEDINLPILSYLIKQFGVGVIESHHQKENYSYIVSGLNNVIQIYFYFDNNLQHFLGIKRNSYLPFKDVNNRIKAGDHLNEVTRKELVLMSNNINSASKKC